MLIMIIDQKNNNKRIDEECIGLYIFWNGWVHIHCSHDNSDAIGLL